MWRIRATTSRGLQRNLPFRSLDDEGFSLAAANHLAAEIAEGMPSHEWPSHLLASETYYDAPGMSSIGRWNHLVSDSLLIYTDSGRPASSRLKPIGDAISLLAGDSGRLEFVARHDRTTLVFPVHKHVDSVTLEYKASTDDAMNWRCAARSAGVELSWVESRFYLGTRSATLLGFHPLRTYTPIPAGWERARIKTGGVTGMCVATVVRTAGEWAKKLDTDPMHSIRLEFSVNRHGHRGWPELRDANLPASGRVWVLVHGTLSSCYEAFADLPQDVFGGDPVFRFEHDTCAGIEANAERLFDLLARASNELDITILAHSRGGLVARAAGTRLTRLQTPLHVRVLTFGTPHLGTPFVAQATSLVAVAPLGTLVRLLGPMFPGWALPRLFGWWAPTVGKAVLSLVARMGIGNGVGDARYDATLIAMAYALLRAGRLPNGISVMGESSDYLKLMANTMAAWPGCAAWAGAFDIDSDPAGFGVAFEQELSAGLFGGARNDLIVPTESALAFGDRTEVQGCAHTRYFGRPDIQAALKDTRHGLGDERPIVHL